jgi:holo-[acyl-carrier-protein] synthase
MIYGIGADICDVRRIRASLDRYGERFAQRVLAPGEMATWQARSARWPERGVRFVGTRFSAKEAFSKAIGLGMRMPMSWRLCEIANLASGAPVVVLEHITRLTDDICPDWPQPAQDGGNYRIEITGEPCYAMDICLTSRNGDHNFAGVLATATRLVNAIPAVIAAEPGIRTTLDLPLVTGKGLYAGRKG